MRPCPQCNNVCDSTHQFCPSCGFPIGKVQGNGEDPLIGRTLPGGFVILELIGVGGMGRVYRAEQTNLGRTVAVKIVHLISPGKRTPSPGSSPRRARRAA